MQVCIFVRVRKVEWENMYGDLPRKGYSSSSQPLLLCSEANLPIWAPDDCMHVHVHTCTLHIVMRIHVHTLQCVKLLITVYATYTLAVKSTENKGGKPANDDMT